MGNNDYPITPFPQTSYGALGEALALPLQAYAAKKAHDLQFQDLLRQYMMKSSVEGNRVRADSPGVIARPGSEMRDPNTGFNTVNPMDFKESIINMMFPQLRGGSPMTAPMGPSMAPPMGSPTAIAGPSPMGPGPAPAPAPPGPAATGGTNRGVSGIPPGLEPLMEYATGIKMPRMADSNIVNTLFDYGEANNIKMPPRPSGPIYEADLANYEQVLDRGIRLKEFEEKEADRNARFREHMDWLKQNRANAAALKSEAGLTKFFQFQEGLPGKMADLENKAALNKFGDAYKIGGFDRLPFKEQIDLENSIADSRVALQSSLSEWSKLANQQTLSPLYGTMSDRMLKAEGEAKQAGDAKMLAKVQFARQQMSKDIQAGKDPAESYKGFLYFFTPKEQRR